MANTYLSRTNSSSGTSDKIFTYSFWIKRAKVDAEHCIAGAGTSQREFIRFESTGELTYRRTSGSAFQFTTLRKFRDVGAWYNIVFNIDSRLSSGGDRVKLYVNGVSETAVSAATDMGQNYTPKIGAAELQTIGKDSEQANPYFDGCMSHVHFIDGIRYDASYFGSTDSTTGEWKINTSPSVTYGTNGFTILKDGNTITDQSSNSNNFTLSGGTLTNTEDCPDNNFATMNPLFAGDANITYSNGNLKTTATNASQKNAVSTIGVSSGKWYCEMVSRNGTNYPGFGIMDSQSVLQTSVSYLGSSSDSYCMFQDGNYYTNGSASSTGTTWGVGSIMGVAIDLDSSTKTIKFYKNGSQTHSATIATPANAYVFAVSHNTDGTITEINFGNGYFGTTAVSSAGTNASGIGIFEYDVPSGYTALSTKGLNI